MNAYLEAWRHEQHETAPTVSDQQLAAFLAGCDASQVILDRAANASEIELRMIGRSTSRSAA